ncbi:hypothetical protein [Sphingomonas nostoxanthinifaciens]|uniref:hypothetical protein n=1 Tax=Sphingomonas nostoxanthinifaciens TaxID=2872652 RepID=UPI001CC1CBC8|nr:hypothetical protein [Sphingomonas nostoxanthinifaciens]UAK23272.1 hypothetical protein K8P63_12745 [Sphingomonas nostoxanthinifaciens]
MRLAILSGLRAGRSTPTKGRVRARRAIMRPIAGLMLAIGAVPAVAADYAANLGPMPLDDETKAVIAGRGEAQATLDGTKLTVTGHFGSLPSAATVAGLFESPAIGVPGKRVLALMIATATSGEISGSFRLTPAQAQALRTGRLYVQIDSEKAPPGYGWGPKGTLWGWLLPAHAKAVQGVPQQGPWFIPQLDTPSR